MMPAFALPLTPRRCRRAPVVGCINEGGAPSVAQRRVRRSALCDTALQALRDSYAVCNALPQTGGCAHALGRVAEAVRSDALNTLALAGGGNAKYAALHDSATHAALSVLGRVGVRKGDEIVLALNDDPRLTAPMHAAATARNMTVRWVLDTNFPDIAPAINARTRLIALQIISPLLGAAPHDEGGLYAALNFARSAGVPVLLDGTHMLSIAPIRASDLPADIVVLAGDAIRAHRGAAISLWQQNVWERLDTDIDRCAFGDSSTAAAAALAAAMSGESFGVENAQLAVALGEELREVNGVQILGGSDFIRAVPVVAMCIPDGDGGSKARYVARELCEALPDKAEMARLRVIPSFSEGRGKRKVVRPELLCMEFSAVQHDVDDVRRFVRAVADVLIN